MPDPYRTPSPITLAPRGPRWATEWQKVWVLLRRRLPWTRERLRWELVQRRRTREMLGLLATPVDFSAIARMGIPSLTLPHPPGRPVDS